MCVLLVSGFKPLLFQTGQLVCRYSKVKNLGPPETQSPGELGAATIVGSAAFNLLSISAVCMASVPKGEVRGISQLKVRGGTS
jgi:hypothetical protein